MAEGIMERAVLEALAAAGLPTALVDGTAPFRVRWANAAFAHSLRLGAAPEGQPLLELLGGNSEGMATILRGLGDEGPLSVVVESQGETRRRERELSFLPVPGPGREPAVLVLAHDVTEREEARRRLEAENLRLALFASVARHVASIDPTRVVEAAVGAACTISNGPTAIYLVGHEGEIARTATAGMSATIAGLLPMTVRPGRLQLLRRALELGCRQSLPYAPGLPADERTLLGEAAARWLVATPIRGRHGVLGALLTLWRQRRPGEVLPLAGLHQCVAAYASDLTLLDTATLPHAIAWNDGRYIMASLDHAMWFHRPFRADEWLLYAQESPSASRARGLATGRLFTRDGRLVASVAQEGLMRPVAQRRG